MVVYVLLKGYDFEGFGSNVEVYKTREKAELAKKHYMEGTVKDEDGDIEYDYGYDFVKIVKRTVS